MKTLKKLFEKNYCERFYCALEMRDNERGFGKLIHTLTDIKDIKEGPKSGLIEIKKFNDFLSFLEANPTEDLYFTGPIIYAYEKYWRFRLYIKNRGLTQYFKNTSSEDLENRILGIS